MATIYVRTTGNDTTGDGSTGKPYATVGKAISVAVGSDLILIGTGTYAENNGAGYLTINNRTFGVSYVTITTETGERDVVITGVSSSYVMSLAICSGLWFDNLVFTSTSASTLGVLRIVGGSKSGITFSRCKFRIRSSGSQTNSGILSAWTGSGTDTIEDITFNLCEIEQIGHYNAAGVNLDNQSTGNTIRNIDLIDCKIYVGGTAFRVKGTPGCRQINCNFNSFNLATAANTYQIGEDAATGVATTAFASNITSYSCRGHAGVVGAGVTEWYGDGCLFTGGSNSSSGQGLVFKNSTGFRLTRSTIHGGYNSSLYFKAAYNGLVAQVSAYNKYATSSAVRVGVNSENDSKAFGVVLRQSFLQASAGKVVDWSGASGDSGGSVCDQNVYQVSGTAALGTVGASTVTSIATLRAAWSGYSVPQNDGRSRLGVKSIAHSGDITAG